VSDNAARGRGLQEAGIRVDAGASNVTWGRGAVKNVALAESTDWQLR
jgi:hypothetical protein